MLLTSLASCTGHTLSKHLAFIRRQYFFSIFVVERQNSLINISAEFSVLLYPENGGEREGTFVGRGQLPLDQPGDRHPLITEICKKSFQITIYPLRQFSKLLSFDKSVFSAACFI
jgi:hypothetical protein